MFQQRIFLLALFPMRSLLLRTYQRWTLFLWSFVLIVHMSSGHRLWPFNSYKYIILKQAKLKFLNKIDCLYFQMKSIEMALQRHTFGCVLSQGTTLYIFRTSHIDVLGDNLAAVVRWLLCIFGIKQSPLSRT